MKIIGWINTLIAKSNVKYLRREVYSRYKVIVEFKDGNIEIYKYDKYYYGCKDDILKVFIKPRSNLYISNGEAFPYETNIKRIRAEVINEMYGYWLAGSITSWIPSWMSEIELIENNKKYEKEIKLKYGGNYERNN